MELRSVIIGILIGSLTGCASIQSDVPDAPSISIGNDGYFASIARPENIINQYERRDGSTAYTSFEAPTTDYVPSDIMIEVYPALQAITDCSPSITGASQTEELHGTNGETVWGRVDVWEQFGEGDIPDWRNVLCRKDGTPPPAEVYALCSEKDGKRVLICISQMTDNPQLAEEIFGTFRWTK